MRIYNDALKNKPKPKPRKIIKSVEIYKPEMDIPEIENTTKKVAAKPKPKTASKIAPKILPSKTVPKSAPKISPKLTVVENLEVDKEVSLEEFDENKNMCDIDDDCDLEENDVDTMIENLKVDDVC